MSMKNTKKLVQGAMIASLCGVLSLLNSYTGGFFDLFIYYFIAIYIAWYGYQYSLKDNILVFLTSMIVVFFTGIPTFIIQTIAYGIVGLFIGEALRKKASSTTIIFGTFVICLLNNIMIYTVLSALFEIDLIGEMTLLYNELNALTSIPISLDLFLSFIPLVLCILSILETYVIHLLCQLVFTKLKIAYPRNFHIASLKIPYYVGIVLLFLVLIGVVLLRYFHVSEVYGQYCLILGLIGFMVQGYALLNYFAIVKNLRYFIILGCFLFFIPLGIYIYIILGFLDIFTPIRKYIKPQTL